MAAPPPARLHERPAELLVAADERAAQVGERGVARLGDADPRAADEQVGDPAPIAHDRLKARDRRAIGVEQDLPPRLLRIPADRHATSLVVSQVDTCGTI